MKDNIRRMLLESLLTEKDNRKILIDKEGVSQELADWAHGLHKKLSIWIIKSLKAKYKQEMADASKDDKTSLDNYAKALDGDYREIMRLVATDNKPQLNLKQLSFDEAMEYVGRYQHIAAWLNDPTVDITAERGAGFLKSMSWEDALAMADEWHSSLTAGGEVEDIMDEKDSVIHTFGNGFMWVLRKDRYCEKSRASMGHCGTASRQGMWLLRLIYNNREFVTVDWDPSNGETIQLKGKGNKKPLEKYHPYIEWLLKNKEWGGIQKLHTHKGYLPHTNFHLGEMKPEVAAEIYAKNPGLLPLKDFIANTPNNKKSALIVNLLKIDEFLFKLIPFKFSKIFNMLEGKDLFTAIGFLINHPSFFERMNKYNGVLAFTIEEMLGKFDKQGVKDKLIMSLLEKDGFIDMLDDEATNLLINAHSDSEMVDDMIMQAHFGGEWDDEEEEEEEPEEEEESSAVNESIRRRKQNILSILRKNRL